MTVDEATWRFVDEHLQDDVRQLALKKSKYTGIDFDFALQQIQGRQKTRDKLPLLCTIPRFVFPPTLALEQCSSEITAKYKVHIFDCRDAARHVSTGNDSVVGDAMHCVSTEDEINSVVGDGVRRVSTNSIWTDGVFPIRAGTSMADLTGGFGIDTLFLSNMFETCHYVEPQQQLCEIMSHNLRLLQKENVIVHQDTMEHLVETMEPVDFLYLDPSRRNMLGKKVTGIEDCTPNVLQYKDLLLQKGKKVMLKLSPMLDIKRSLAQLPNVFEVHVLAVNGECKELLLLMGQDEVSSVKYHAVNILADNLIDFEFTADEEANTLPDLAATVDNYLYEPNAAIMKAGAFKTVSNSFRLKKLHPHTHLYTSESKIATFPGRIFRVQSILPLKQAQMALKDVRQANVAVRNFPLTAEELKRKLKLADGGDVYIFGATIEKEQKVIIICSKEK